MIESMDRFIKKRFFKIFSQSARRRLVTRENALVLRVTSTVL